MLDPVDAGRQRVLHAEQRVGVRHDGEAGIVRLVDEHGRSSALVNWAPS